MADLNSTSPDIYHQVNNNETLSHYERRLDSFPAVSEKTGKVIIDTEKNVATILVSSETKKETDVLSEDFKKEFIEKLMEKTTREDIKDAIERQTLKIIEILGKKRIAISLNGKYIDYISNLDGEIIFNLKKFKNTEIVGDMININLKDKYGIVFENGNYFLNGKKITIYNNTLINGISEGVDIVLNFEKLLKEELEKREK